MRTIKAQVLGITGLTAGVECAFVQRHLPKMFRLSHVCMDSTFPRKRLADILEATYAMGEKYLLRCPKVFHAGDDKLQKTSKCSALKALLTHSVCSIPAR